jgi:hypothetical protein
LRRSTRKDENKKKRQTSEAKKHKPKRDVPAGFRRLAIGTDVYGWRSHDYFVEIRTPGKLDIKWLVPIWQLHGHKSREAWETEHENCCRSGCCDPCTEYMATPGMVRKYIDTMRTATC